MFQAVFDTLQAAQPVGNTSTHQESADVDALAMSIQPETNLNTTI